VCLIGFRQKNYIPFFIINIYRASVTGGIINKLCNGEYLIKKVAKRQCGLRGLRLKLCHLHDAVSIFSLCLLFNLSPQFLRDAAWGAKKLSRRRFFYPPLKRKKVEKDANLYHRPPLYA
jgi:hypothetical protein